MLLEPLNSRSVSCAPRERKCAKKKNQMFSFCSCRLYKGNTKQVCWLNRGIAITSIQPSGQLRNAGHLCWWSKGVAQRLQQQQLYGQHHLLCRIDLPVMGETPAPMAKPGSCPTEKCSVHSPFLVFFQSPFLPFNTLLGRVANFPADYKRTGC